MHASQCGDVQIGDIEKSHYKNSRGKGFGGQE